MVTMAKETKYKMSAERLQELKDELQYLQNVREKEVAEQIKEARSFGDLSENSEYDEAKTEQGKLYSKIAEVKNLIDNAEIIKTTDETDIVGLGSIVTVKALATGAERKYTLVGSQDLDLSKGKVSDESPFGKSVIGLKVGDIASMEAPSGTQQYEILNIDR
jgi:transcription elongation factor GreA